MKIFGLFILFGLCLASCNADDDICLSGEATPRMKIKFKDTSNKIKNPDTLYIDVDYGAGKVSVINKAILPDSALIPLRVDESSFTELYIRKRKQGPVSKIKLNYTTQSKYVSPACGVKKTYQNIDSQLIQSNPVVKTEVNQTEISDENKTHIYLIF